MDHEQEADRAWQELVVATYRLHRELACLVRAGRLSVDPYERLHGLLHEADAALAAWNDATERCDS